MFILIYSGNELLASDNDVRTFETHDEAWANMADRFVDAIRAEGNEPVLTIGGGDVFDRYDNTLFLGYLNDDEAYTEHCEEKWVIFEVSSPSQSTDETIGARTIDYRCAPDPRFRSGEVLSHQATLRWESGKSFECHAPGRIELRVGGTPYEYKAL